MAGYDWSWVLTEFSRWERCRASQTEGPVCEKVCSLHARSASCAAENPPGQDGGGRGDTLEGSAGAGP